MELKVRLFAVSDLFVGWVVGEIRSRVSFLLVGGVFICMDVCMNGQGCQTD